MKTWKIAVAVALVMLTAASAFAAGTTKTMSHNSNSTSGNWTLGIQGGMSKPTGDYGDLANAGWNFGGQADYWMNPQWGFGGDVAYHANSGSDAVNAALVADPFFGPGSSMKFSVIQYGVHTTYMFPTQGGSAFPYLQGGMGGYNVKSTIDGGLLPSDVSQSKFGLNFGAGVDFRASPTVNLGVNGTYHYISADPSALNWFGIEGRVTFKIPTSTK